MATLSRVTGKVFGGNAPLDEIGIFGSAKAGNPTNSQDVATIQSGTAYEEGWGSGIVTNNNFPPMEEVTGVLKTLSYQICYLLQEGIPDYDIGTNYSNKSVVKLVNGNEVALYVSLQNDNIGNSLTDTTYWKEIVWGNNANTDLSNLTTMGEQRFSDLATAIETLNTNLTNLNNSVVKLTGNQTISGTKTFNTAPKMPNSNAVGTGLALAARGSAYIKLGDGTLIQWGQADALPNLATVTLPIPYTSNGYKVVVSDFGQASLTGQSYFTVRSLTTTSFKIQTSSSVADACFWIAIGR